jgi:xanthine dehydrogenase molybdenum-binding subunit
MAYMHIGKNFVPPDVPGKVTGKIKYAEDYVKEGMVYARLLLSPLANARVTNIDAAEALAMPGVVGILTADDVYPDGYDHSTALQILTNTPTMIGEPILAVAALDEKTAEDAIERISITFERLPFVMDPLDSLQQGGPNAYPGGNVFDFRTGFQEVKWTPDQVASFRAGNEPTAEPSLEWQYGDLEQAFAQCAFVYEGTYTNVGYPHQSMEPRSALSYWENGKCYLYAGSQSLGGFAPGMAQIIGVEPENFVFVNEACGGGFGQKSRHNSMPVLAVPARFSRKLGRPVMLRITREEETTIGGTRYGFQGWIKVGFASNGRMRAFDTYIVGDAGGKGGGGDASSAATAVSLLFQPEAARLRAVGVGTNTAHRGAQRGPGENQMSAIIDPIIHRAALQLGLDPLEMHRINAADNSAVLGPTQGAVTSAYAREALDIGAGLFNYDERILRAGQRRGSKVTGVGVGQGYHSAGRSGMDGIVRLLPDGRLAVHSGVGNLGTYSYAATARAAAEELRISWDRVEIFHGRTDNNVPIASPQDGSNSIFTHTRANVGAVQDLKQKMREIAALDLGGQAQDYDIAFERVFRRNDRNRGMSFAAVAQRAMELGGRFDGHEYPEELNSFTKISVERLAGTGLVGVYNDGRHNGTPPGIVASFCELEVDVETGKFEIIELVSVADCGTVFHPQGLINQLRGGAVWGIGMSGYEQQVYDPQNGLPHSVGYWQSKVPTNMDVPSQMKTGWVDKPDPEVPFGGRGVGEPAMGCVTAAINSALTDALGGHVFNAAPITPGMIINHVAGIAENARPLAQNNFRG